MVAFPVVLLAAGTDGATHDVSRAIAWVVGLPALVASYYSAAAYVPTMRAALREGRQARR